MNITQRHQAKFEGTKVLAEVDRFGGNVVRELTETAVRSNVVN